MQTHVLPRTGLRVSAMCLGAMTFGSAWGAMGADRATSLAMLRRFADAGGNFIDTANNYQEGESERIVGEFVRQDRDRFVVATKYTISRAKGDPNAWGNHRKNLRRSVEASLGRLGTDHVDLLYVHIWDGGTACEDLMRALDDLVRAGKVLHVGASDTPAWVVARANALADARGWTPFSFVQAEHSLLAREAEHEILPMAAALGVTVTAWSPLAGGLLTGKHGGDAPADGGRADWVRPRLAEPRTAAVLAAVTAVASETGRPAAQVALAWLRARRPPAPTAHSAPVVPVCGVRTPAQLDDALAAFDLGLSPDQTARLDAASAIPPSFPARMWLDDKIASLVTGGTHRTLAGWRRPV